MEYFAHESFLNNDFSEKLKNLQISINKIYEIKEAIKNQDKVIRLHSSTLDKESTFACLETLLRDKITTGEITEKYEKAFSGMMKSYSVVSNNSGSSANLLAVSTLIQRKILKPGDKVVVPSLSWSTSVFPLVQYGLIPIFCDANDIDFNIDHNKLIEICELYSPKAMLLIHTYGCPSDMDQIMDVVNNFQLVLIEDTCESMGSEWKGQPSGTFGRVSTFSSYFSHHICTLEGGLTCFKYQEDAQIAKSIRSHGWIRHYPEDSEIFKQYPDIDRFFMFDNLGYNIRISEPQAALGLEQLKKLKSFIKTRREIASLFTKFFYEYDDYISFIKPKKGAYSSWFGFPIILKKDLEGQVNFIRKELMKKNIESRPFLAGDFSIQPVSKKYKNIVFAKNDVCRNIQKNGFALPCHQSLKIEDFEYIKESLNSILSKLLGR